MATAIKWSVPTSLSASLVTTQLDSLGNGSESAVSSAINNTAGSYLYAAIIVVLGSITPATGGSLSLRLTVSDGTNTADKVAGDMYTAVLLSGASIKVVVFSLVRLPPFNCYLSVVNNSGVAFNAADSDIYYRAYGETT